MVDNLTTTIGLIMNATTTIEAMMMNTTTTEIPPPPPPQHGNCIKMNQSDPFKIGDKYQGIPVNIVTNLIGWVVLIVLFVFIRKNAVKKLSLQMAATTVDSIQTAVTTHWYSVFFGR